MQAVEATQPYSEKAWQVLVHLARQPGHASLHPLLTERPEVRNVLVVMISSDRGLAGAYNINIVREALEHFRSYTQPVDYVAVGRKGRDMLIRRRRKVIADFSDLPIPLSFIDVSPIGRLIVDDFLQGIYDQVFIGYTKFTNMARQTPTIRKLLPLTINLADGEVPDAADAKPTHSVFTYEPDGTDLLDSIIPRFTALQVYQSILSSQASEHAARMVAMRNATDNAQELLGERSSLPSHGSYQYDLCTA